MKRIFSVCILVMTMLLATYPITAQEYDFSHTMVNGLKIYHLYTYEEIVDALGEPDEIDTLYVTDPQIIFVYNTDVYSEYGHMLRDSFGFYTTEDGKYHFVDIGIYSKAFLINGFMKVGDTLDKLQEMGGAFKYYHEDDGSICVVWQAGGTPGEEYEWMCLPHFYLDQDGKLSYVSMFCM